MTKFYKQLTCRLFIAAFILVTATNANAQMRGLYADTIKWPNSNNITVNIRTAGIYNVISLSGTINWDKNSLQYVSHAAGSAMGATSNYSFNSNNAVSAGNLSYIYLEANLVAQNVPDGSVFFSINFSIINNPVSTFNDNVVAFTSSPTALEIDTINASSDAGAITASYNNGMVSYARNGYLTYSGGTVTDTVTNRPAGCTYQWLLNGNPITGPNSGTFPNAPAGNISLQVTYPNSTVVTSVNVVTPVTLKNLYGRNIDHTNIISWVTANETNVSNFEIERSNNAQDFVTIGKVRAIGNSTIAQNYSYNDAGIAPKSIQYYRLKINDIGGKFSYSNIIKVSNDVKASALISVAPSIITNNVQLSTNMATGEVVRVDVSNAAGAVIGSYKGSVDYLKSTLANVLSNKTSGLYLFTFTTAADSYTQKVFKN